MTQCETRRWTTPAEYTVVFEDPDESLPYCGRCAKWEFFADDNATTLTKGAD